MNPFEEIKRRLRDFAAERDWEQFHSPKNLSMALIVEAGELVEHFQWLTEEQSAQPDEKKRQAIAAEISDVQIYLLRLADKLGVDIEAAVAAKLRENGEKYPADRVRGSAAKYTEYE